MGDSNTISVPPSTRVLDISQEIVILAFDLAGEEVKDVPGRLIQMLHDVNLQKEIKEFLNDYSTKLLQQNGTSKQMTAKDAGNLALKGLQGQGQKLGKEVLRNLADQVQGTQEFEDLKEQLKALGEEFTDQPIGVWFTDTKAYVIAAGVLITGGAAVFATYSAAKKFGVATVLSKLEGQSVSMKMFGSLDLGAQIAKVDKSKGIVDFKVTGTKDWKPLTFSIEVIGHASLKDLTRVEGAGVNAKIAMQVSKNVQLEVKGGADKLDFSKGRVVADLEAILKIKPDTDQPFSVNIGAGIRGGNGRRPEESFSFNIEIPLGGSGGSKYDYLVGKGLDR